MTTDPTIPHLSPHIAHVLISKSALHAHNRHSQLGNNYREPSDEMDRGIILEAMVFGTTKDRIVKLNYDDFKTVAAREARDRAHAERKVPVLEAKYRAFEEVAQAVSQQLAEFGLLFPGESQKTFTWERDGVPCKGILDHWVPESGLIMDLKCVRDASTSKCQRNFVDYGYDIQAAAYEEGAAANHPELAGRIKKLWMFCEVEKPYAINIIEPSGTMAELGKRKWARAVRQWGECLRTGVYPGYSKTVVRVEALPWQLSNEPIEGESDDDHKEV